MRRDVVLSSFVLTADEWDAMDPLERAALLRAGGTSDPSWLPPIPPLPARIRARGTTPADADVSASTDDHATDPTS